ncbi:MAG: hypothetical protein ACRD5W_06285, partial [Candidatus Acidiferrales bacterium]
MVVVQEVGRPVVVPAAVRRRRRQTAPNSARIGLGLPSHSGVAHLCAPMLDAFFVPPQFALEESADSEFLLFGQII